MDAFFASVEVRRRPELRGRPVIVGGTGPRGVVSSASYEARAFGVRSAMPGAQARRLCPQAVFLPPDFAGLRRGVPGGDGDLRRRHAAGRAALGGRGVPRRGRRAAAARPRRPRSPGRSAARVAAELAADLLGRGGADQVPGQARLHPGQAGRAAGRAGRRVLEFLHPLPVEALWGVGERTAETLRRLGLRTVGDVAAGAARDAALGASARRPPRHLHELAWGRDPRPVSPERVEKSIGAETTFDVDVADPDVIRRTLLGAGRPGRRAGCARPGRPGGRWRSRCGSPTSARSAAPARCATPTDVAREIFDTAWALYEALRPGDRIRLVGVRVEGLARRRRGARQLDPGRARARLAGRRTGGRRGGGPVRRAVVGRPACSARSLLRAGDGRRRTGTESAETGRTVARPDRLRRPVRT